MTDLTKLTVDELHQLFVDDGARLTVLANERQAILAEMEARQKAAAVQAGIAGMSADQLEALRKALGPPSFTSQTG